MGPLYSLGLGYFDPEAQANTIVENWPLADTVALKRIATLAEKGSNSLYPKASMEDAYKFLSLAYIKLSPQERKAFETDTLLPFIQKLKVTLLGHPF